MNWWCSAMLLLINILHYCFLQAEKVSDHWPIEIQFKDSSESIFSCNCKTNNNGYWSLPRLRLGCHLSAVIAFKLCLCHLELKRIVDRFVHFLFFSSSHKLTEMRNSSSKSLLQSPSGISVYQRSPKTSFSWWVPKTHCCRKVSLRKLLTTNVVWKTSSFQRKLFQSERREIP